MTYTIRPATLADASPLAHLLREVGWFETINSQDHTAAAAHVEKHLTQCLADNSHSVYIGVEEAGDVLGYVSVHWLAYLFLPGPEGYVSELFLHPSARGKGLGTALLETVKAEAQKRGVYRLSLLNNQTRESYQRGFYQKQGWEERPVMSNFIYRMEKH